MSDQQAEKFEVRTLLPMADGSQPTRRRVRKPGGALWSKSLATAIPATRPTVAHPETAPFAAVALLNFFKRTAGKPKYLGYATGFFIKSDLVMTAGHNLTMSSADIVGIYPAWDARLNRSGVISALRWCPASSRDIGVLLTNPSPSAISHLNSVISPVATLVGYASDYPDGTNRMSSGTGACHLEGSRLVYDVDAQQADSGAPILSATNSVMAIHVALMGRPDGGMVGVGEHVDAQLLALVARLEASVRGNP